MLKMIRAALPALFLFASESAAQNPAPPVPQSSYLKWENLRMVLSPDSGSLLLWANLGEVENFGTTQFMTTVDPTAVSPWVAGVRAFLAQKLSGGDTGSVRTSPMLMGQRSRIYVGRRRENGNWSKERILVLERIGDRNPMLFAPKEKDLLMILDSIEAVALRAPPARTGPDPQLGQFGRFDQPARMLPVHPLDYPAGEIIAHRDGLVLLRFVVGADGKVDLGTVQVIHSTGPAFLKSVLDALPKYEFTPARFRGEPVRYPLVMPFTFYFKR
jgi:hypothetical protein